MILSIKPYHQNVRETGFTIKCNEIPFQRWNTDTGYIAGIAIGEFVLKKIAR